MDVIEEGRCLSHVCSICEISHGGVIGADPRQGISAYFHKLAMRIRTVEFYESGACIPILVKAECVHCPWALQGERSANS